jgi:hypothetical protein
MPVSRAGRSRLAAVLALAAMFVIAVSPVSAANAKVGAKLSPGIFPSNAYPGTLCDHELDGGSDVYQCTWILNQAFGGGTVTAPRNGFINKIKVINGQGGALKFVIAQKSGTQFRVLRMSAKINYSTDQCNPDCSVHTYTISPAMQISTGNYIGIQATKTSTLRCDSGGPKILLFRPPLGVNGPLTSPTDDSGCWLLLTAVYRP